jgi:hypothetical protein
VLGRRRPNLPPLPTGPGKRAAGPVVDTVANPGLHDLHDGANERAQRVILAAVAPGVAHVLDLGFIEVRKFVLLGLGTEAQFVDVVDDLAEVVAARNLVLDLSEYFTDLVFDGVRPAGLLLEPVQIRKQLAVDEVPKVIADLRLVVVDLAVFALGRGSLVPAVRPVKDEVALLPLQCGFIGFILLQCVQIFSGRGATKSAQCNPAR